MSGINTSLYSKVLRVEIQQRDTILNGKSWGNSGAYELLRGRVFFGIDPFLAANQNIVDIHFAPVNGDGLIESMSDIVILKPVIADASKIALIEVSNRGGKFIPNYFLQGHGRLEDPQDALAFGDGLLMEMGLTMIWIGWQFDVPEAEHSLNFFPPIAQYPEGTPIIGRVRSDWTLDQETHNLKLGHRNHAGYPVYAPHTASHTLTFRKGRDSARIVMDTTLWDFGRWEEGRVVDDPHFIHAPSGFKPGYIYELVYYAKDPPLVGLGLSALRDIASYVKFDTSCTFSSGKAIAAGVSQTGRFLRHFLYQGFNQTEFGQTAFDGMMIITAGAGRGSFNHRFAQPSRDGHQYSAFFYPTDIFPFSSRAQEDATLQVADGLMSHLPTEFRPKIFYINTGYEYYGRAASLIHTSLDGMTDIRPLPNERIFHIASGQHFVDQMPDSIKDKTIHLGNPLQFKPNYRALLVALHDWVDANQTPPLSKYPLIAAKDLVRLEARNYPKIGGFSPNSVAHTAYHADYGPQWNEGIITKQPPELGPTFPTLVPQVDAFGNERGGIRNFELRVPLASFIPYAPHENPDRLYDFRGLFIPLPSEEVMDDDRTPIQELYANKSIYLTKVKEALRTLVAESFVLARDMHFLLDHASRYWNMIVAADKDERQLSVMSFNIRYDNPNDGISSWDFRRDHVSEIIEKYAPDFLGLQEALLHQCRDVSRELKGYKWFGVGREDGEKKGEYAPIFYQNRRWKLANSGHFWLSETPDRVSVGWDAAFARIVTWGVFRQRNGTKQIYVFNTHFDHRGKIARSKSIELLKEKVKSIAGNHPYLILGDFNFDASSDPYLSIAGNESLPVFDARHMSSTEPLGPAGTFSGFTVQKNLPRRRIDHIFISDHFGAKNYEVINASKNGFYASDHFAVFSQITW